MHLGFPSLILAALAQAKAITTPEQAFKKADIVPKIVPVFQPTLDLHVTYVIPNTTTLKSAELGDVFKLSEPVNQPIFSVSPIKGKSASLANEYVVLMFDPDAPTPANPNISQIRHFVGGGFKPARLPSTDSKYGTELFNTSAPLSPYRNPAPPTADLHRYIFLIYAQPANFTTTPFATPVTNFNATLFAEQNALGPVLGGNFLRAGNTGV